MANPWSLGRRDAAIDPADFALPAGASSSTLSEAIDLGSAISGGKNPRLEEMEIAVLVPALTATMLPNTRTLTIDLQDSADNVTYTDRLATVGVLTGAGGVGASAAEFRVKIPSDTLRYIKVQATTGVSTTTMAAVSATVHVMF